MLRSELLGIANGAQYPADDLLGGVRLRFDPLQNVAADLFDQLVSLGRRQVRKGLLEASDVLIDGGHGPIRGHWQAPFEQ